MVVGVIVTVAVVFGTDAEYEVVLETKVPISAVVIVRAESVASVDGLVTVMV